MCVFSGSIQAQSSLLQYAFSSTVAPTAKNDWVNASDFGRSWGGSPIYGSGYTPPLNYPAPPSLQAGSSSLGASSGTTYFSFNLQASSDALHNQLVFGTGSSISFYLGAYQSGEKAYTVSYDVQWSTLPNSGFASLGTGGWTGQKNLLTWRPQVSMSLSALGVHSNPTTVYFRIYLWDNVNTGSDYALVDNVTVTGAVVPEPAPGALLAGIGLVAVYGCRRTRARLS